MIKPPVSLVAGFLCATFAPWLLPVSVAADSGQPAAATEKVPGDAKTELDALIQKVQDKVEEIKKEGKALTEKSLADELKQYDAILKEHKGEQTNDVAQVLFMKAQLYVEILDDSAKATALFTQLEKDFPDTVPGMRAPRSIAALAAMEPWKKIQRALVRGTVFPDFDVKDTDGNPVSVAKYKGKVVLVDFWATWCGPCVGEVPNVINVYNKYHDQGLEIIGISRDYDVDSLKSFVQEKQMPWPEYFDGGDNALAQKYGAIMIPFNILVGRDGKIIDKNLRGDDLDSAVAKAIGIKPAVHAGNGA